MDGYTQLVDTFKRFDDLAKDVGFRYVINYGSVIGWQRSGSIIPYDHDVDVVIGKSDAQKIIDKLNAVTTAEKQ